MQGFSSSKKCYAQLLSTWCLLDQGSNAYSTELAWHVLGRGSLNWLFLIHHLLLTLDPVIIRTSPPGSNFFLLLQKRFDENIAIIGNFWLIAKNSNVVLTYASATIIYSLRNRRNWRQFFVTKPNPASRLHKSTWNIAQIWEKFIYSAYEKSFWNPLCYVCFIEGCKD